MKKLLEDNSSDEVKKVQVIQYTLTILTFCMFILVRSQDLSFFKLSFYTELIFLFFTFRFYLKAHKNKNYAFWGLTIIIALYLIKNILQFTFIDYNIVVLYLAFLAGIFLLINSYIMSSPLYYPRIQWWEYDFRYRGELKGSLTSGDKNFDIRLADLRRDTLSILGFDQLKLRSEVSIDIPYGSDVYQIHGVVKTIREVIPGRPIRYGISLQIDSEADRKHQKNLMKMWSLHKKAAVRRKFADYKEENGH
jgi:hypothetical protein